MLFYYYQIIQSQRYTYTHKRKLSTTTKSVKKNKSLLKTHKSQEGENDQKKSGQPLSQSLKKKVVSPLYDIMERVGGRGGGVKVSRKDYTHVHIETCKEIIGRW